MTKRELLAALEWIKDEAELHVAVPHPALDTVLNLYSLKEVRYRLQPSRVELVAVPQDQLGE